MNKTELIDKVAEDTGLEKSKVALAVNGVLDAITGALAAHEVVTLIGFGTFKVKYRKARKGVNPRTHKEMTIPAAYVPAISFGESLKESVSKKKKLKSFLPSNKDSKDKKGSKKSPAKKTATKKKK